MDGLSPGDYWAIPPVRCNETRRRMNRGPPGQGARTTDHLNDPKQDDRWAFIFFFFLYIFLTKSAAFAINIRKSECFTFLYGSLR